ncbi:hypothetical protein [Reyranella sp.]|uniref:hypothetical protein n=1 Tax=Reyranella sp. TaxID=1929291 RepID=UPI003BAAE0B1
MAKIAGDGPQKPRKRRLTAKQKVSSLYQLWHSLQDMKDEAASMKDQELSLLIGMIELLVEERTAGLTLPNGRALAAADTTSPN